MTLLQRAEDVADELRTRLLTLTVAQGAESDAGAQVLLGKRAIERTQIPCTVLIEGDDIVARDNERLDYELAQRYVLLAYVPCDPDNPNTAAHAAIRDLKRAVFRTDGKASKNWGGKVKRVEYLGRDIGPRADGEALVQAIVEIAVHYVENVAAP